MPKKRKRKKRKRPKLPAEGRRRRIGMPMISHGFEMYGRNLLPPHRRGGHMTPLRIRIPNYAQRAKMLGGPTFVPSRVLAQGRLNAIQNAMRFGGNLPVTFAQAQEIMMDGAAYMGIYGFMRDDPARQRIFFQRMGRGPALPADPPPPPVADDPPMGAPAPPVGLRPPPVIPVAPRAPLPPLSVGSTMGSSDISIEEVGPMMGGGPDKPSTIATAGSGSSWPGGAPALEFVPEEYRDEAYADLRAATRAGEDHEEAMDEWRDRFPEGGQETKEIYEPKDIEGYESPDEDEFDEMWGGSQYGEPPPQRDDDWWKTQEGRHEVAEEAVDEGGGPTPPPSEEEFVRAVEGDDWRALVDATHQQAEQQEEYPNPYSDDMPPEEYLQPHLPDAYYYDKGGKHSDFGSRVEGAGKAYLNVMESMLPWNWFDNGGRVKLPPPVLIN